MAKNKVSEWSSTPASNTDIGGIDIAEGCAPSGINNAIREMMAQIKDMQSGTDADAFTVGGNLAVTGTSTFTGTSDFTGGFTLDGSAGTSGQVLVSAGSGNTPIWGAAFLSGMIVLWSGSIASIPSGWYLCDGTNSTPDLRSKFIVGAGSTYAVGNTGGSADAVVVSHTHTAVVTDPGHTHAGATAAAGGAAGTVSRVDGTGTQQVKSNTTGITVANSTEGVSGTNANLPPYYALAYIMKS